MRSYRIYVTTGVSQIGKKAPMESRSFEVVIRAMSVNDAEAIAKAQYGGEFCRTCYLGEVR